jgi:hypothetical protein
LDATLRSPLKVKRRFEGAGRLYLQGRRKRRARKMLESECQALQMIRSSETSVEFKWTTRRYNSEDTLLQSFVLLAKNWTPPIHLLLDIQKI